MTLSSLDQALIRTSPRLSPPPTPWRSVVIHGALATLWLLLLARAFLADGLLTWSTGLVYVAYDTALLGLVFWRTLGIVGATPGRSPGGERCSLAVIVAAHNEASVLPVTLAALTAQANPPEMVVIADDGSTDETADTLMRLYSLEPPPLGTLGPSGPRHPSIRWLRLPHGGKAAALNAAMVAVDTDMVLTVDADTLLEPGAIVAMRDAFAADPRLVAATGVLTPVCGPSLQGRIFEWFQTYEYIRNFLSRYAWMEMHSLLLISGAFAAFRRQAVVDVGGFDPACLVEDYELIHRLRRHGVLAGRDWTTAVVGGARGRTEAPGSIPAFLRQRRRWFGGFLQTQYWYRDMVGNRAFGTLGLLMLPIKAADTLQPIFGLTALAVLIAYAAGGTGSVIGPIAGVIGLKLLADVAFHLWGVHLYRRWTGASGRLGYLSALLATAAEPFGFQVLRHLGAAWGWVMFLTGERSWGVQRRLASMVPVNEDRAP